MTSIEERLVRDIEEVTGGLVMAQAEVEQALHQVEQRIGRAQGRGRRRALVAVAAAAAVVAGAVGVAVVADAGGEPDSAPADSAPEVDPDAAFLVGRAPSAEELEGVWRVDNGMTLVRFTADGEVAFDTRGRITDPEIGGTFTLAGDRVTVDLDGGSNPDCRRETVLRVSRPGPGEVRLVHTEPGTVPGCAPEQGGRWVLEHLLPTREGYTRFGPRDGDDFGPLRRAVVPGFWLVVGGGHGLQLSPDGSYVVLGGSGQEIESGQWRLDGNELTLEAGSGCRLAIGGVQHTNPGTDMLRGTLTEHVCEMPWVSGDGGDTMGWWQVPDRTSR